MIGGIPDEMKEQVISNRKKFAQYSASLRKVKGHIFSYLKQEKGISKPQEYKHKNIVRYFLNLTGLELRSDLKFNYALIELLNSPEFEPFLKYKRPKSVARRKKDYKFYISYSPEWQLKREEAFKTYGRICAKCGATENLHVHHIHYDNFMNEKMEDLMIVCKRCHDKIHNRKR